MQFTRQRILEILREKNRATVQQLGEDLGLTPVTIRHHLDVLRGEGLVDAPQALRRSGPGRPQYAYGLTEAAADYFPKNYHSLANLMLDEIRERAAPGELEQIMAGVAQRMAEHAPSPGQKSPQKVLKDAVRFLNGQGYAACWEQGSDGDYVLHVHNCPYKRVAQVHDEVCTMDVHFVSRLIGVAPQRLSRMADGDECCAYLVRF
jgi:predicted ArsR family transcriptional regulator